MLSPSLMLCIPEFKWRLLYGKATDNFRVAVVIPRTQRFDLRVYTLFRVWYENLAT